mgnify:CR=1 FL=1
MKYKQGDIISIPFYDGKNWKQRPAIIISNDDLQQDEEIIYVVMISSKEYNEQYSYKLTQEMYTGQLHKQSYVKCHLIEFNQPESNTIKIGTIKPKFLKEIIEKIKQSIF